MNADERRSEGALWRRAHVWLVLLGLYVCLAYQAPLPAAVLSVVLCRIVWQREKERENCESRNHRARLRWKAYRRRREPSRGSSMRSTT